MELDRFLKSDINAAILLFAILFACPTVFCRAQANLNPKFRTLEFRKDLVYGRAPLGAIIRLYTTRQGSCDALVLLQTTTSVGNAIWAFSGTFDGRLVVSMSQNGAPEEFESNVLTESEFFIGNVDCNNGKGEIKPIPGFRGFRFTWKNSAGETVGTGHELLDVDPGTYTFEYTFSDGCLFKSVPLTVKDLRPYAESREIVLDCNEKDRIIHPEILNSGGLSNASYLWENEAGEQIGNTRDKRLGNGTFYFSFKDGRGCTSNRARYEIFGGTAALASIDQSKLRVKAANCGVHNGAITGITVSVANGQKASYEWFNSKGELVATTLDLQNLPPDVYLLKVSTTQSQCPTYLSDIEVEELNAINVDARFSVTTPTSCGQNNGSIKGVITNATQVRWYNEADPAVTAGQNIDLVGASPGFYSMELRNDIGCIKQYGPFHIKEGSLAISLRLMPEIKGDLCGQATGSITGLTINTAVRSYTWLDEGGNVVGQASNLYDVPAGSYTLVVKSAQCENSFNFVVPAEESTLPAPQMDNIVICSPSNVLINFIESAETYRIYNDQGQLLAQGEAGQFNLSISTPGTYFAALAKGNCEGPRTAFSIQFGSAGLTIPSAFSPNGDGLNDTWIIKGIQNYTSPSVKLFNRQGELVYHGTKPNSVFDGTMNGKDLPTGVYYYIVKASGSCPAASGSLTLMR